MAPRSLTKSPKARLPLLLSFAVPFVLVYLILFATGLHPLGSSQILANDGLAQYYPFLAEFRERLLSGGSLEYTWRIGGGTGYLSLFAYYLASPLNLLCLLVPASHMRDLFAFLTVLKISLGGFFFAYFLKSVYKRNDYSIVFFALLYALCGWVAGYYWNFMWLDGFALLPLLTASTVRLLRDRKFGLYIATLALTLWSNYYIAYFCCIFVFLCFLGYCLICWNGWRDFLSRFLRIAVATLIGAGLTAVLLVPTLASMQTTVAAGGRTVRALELNMASGTNGNPANYDGLWDMLTSETFPEVFYALRQTLTQLLTPSSVTGLSGLPNIFSGFSIVILAVYFFCCKEISLREKLFQAGLLLFLLFSFIFRTLDYFWHGFHFPNLLPYRFSFLFSFVLIGMAFRAYLHMDGFRRRHLFVIVPVALLLLLNSIGFDAHTIAYDRLNGLLVRFLGASAAEHAVWLFSGAVLLGMVAFFLLSAAKHRRARSFATVLLLCILLCEGALSFANGVGEIGLSSYSAYMKTGDTAQTLLAAVDNGAEADFYRTEILSPDTINDGAAYGYNGISVFTSSANVNFNVFSRAFGVSSWPEGNRYTYFESTPITNMLLGIRYLIDGDGSHLSEHSYSVAAQSGDALLLENDAFISLGFMASEDAADFIHRNDSSSAIAEQEELFQRLTGVDEAVFTHLTAQELRCEGSLLRDEDDPYSFTYSTDGTDKLSDVQLSYTVPIDGLYCTSTFFYHGAQAANVALNGEKLMDFNTNIRGILSLGELHAGDELLFSYTMRPHCTASLFLDVAMLNTEVFDRGFEALSDEPWQITEASDTHLSGTVMAKQDGLFFTSVPYEPGWSAYVDGKEVELAAGYAPSSPDVALTDAVIAFPLTAGEHTVTLRYHTAGLTAGAVISCLSLLLLAVLVLLHRKGRLKFLF